jgi:hypothetical protein
MTNIASYRCQECDTVFDSQQELIQHQIYAKYRRPEHQMIFSGNLVFLFFALEYVAHMFHISNLDNKPVCLQIIFIHPSKNIFL